MLVKNKKNEISQRCLGSTFASQSQLPAEPLWKRVPTRDKNGKYYSDFIMLIPGLRQSSEENIRQTISQLNAVLNHYDNIVVFAEMNLKTNTLWVTLKPVPGLSAEIAAMIHHVVPAAKLVSQNHQ